MPPSVLTCNQVRQFDQIAIHRFGMNSLVLMENAARGATDILCEIGQPSKVVILCGSGNNGGDSLVMARHLHLRGWDPLVILLAKPEKLSQDSAANWRILTQTRVRQIDGSEALETEAIHQHLADAEWIVDGITGTGSQPPLREPGASWVRVANQVAGKRLAIDIPSGLHSDSPETTGDVFQADITVSFVARKPVMETATGQRWCGQIRIADIGAPPEIFDLIDSDPEFKGD